MSAHTTRKRPRTDSDDTLKQEPDADLASAAASSTRANAQANLSNGNGSNGSPGPVLARDPEFWFSDGTVILVAKDVEFRYYRALLADHSLVFKAMFAEPHPFRLVPIDGHHSIPCPVVQLADSPEDLRHVLRAYISGKKTSAHSFLGATEPSFYQISAYIRLGRKYELSELVKQSVQFLKRHYTDDHATWAKHGVYWDPSNWRGYESIGVVNVARFIKEPSILPTALLSCVYMDEAIVQGFEREDGTREMLALEDLGRCFRASRTIRQAILTSILRTLRDKVSPICKTEKSCRTALRGALREVEGGMEYLMTSCPFRISLDGLLDGKVRTCAKCTAMVEERIRKERVELWGRLPELLDVEVPGWGNGAPQNEAA